MHFPSTCRYLIRTLSVLQHDPDRPEDPDTKSEDHATDDIRYACLLRPLVKSPPPKMCRRTGIGRRRRINLTKKTMPFSIGLGGGETFAGITKFSARKAYSANRSIGTAGYAFG
jgi:hypothetical protein